MPALTPCPSCARHLLASEVSCPFCAAALAPVEVEARAPLGRVPRAVIFGAALAAATAAGCGARSGPDPDRDAGPRTDSGPEIEDTGPVLMPYGAPPSRARAV